MNRGNSKRSSPRDDEGEGEKVDGVNKRRSSSDRTSGGVGSRRPLVVLLAGADCTAEMRILSSIAEVAYCDAHDPTEIPDKVWNEAVGLLVGNSITLAKEELQEFKSLKTIVRIGSGVDNIDVTAAGGLGIAVCNVPGYGVEEVADTTLCSILNLYRNMHWLAMNSKDKEIFVRFKKAYDDTAAGCARIRGQTLGIVGLGMVGTAVALRAKSVGFNVIFYDPILAEGIEQSLGYKRCLNIEDLLNQSDCVSLHCLLNKHDYPLIIGNTIKLMREGALLVSTVPGALVDVAAVAAALCVRCGGRFPWGASESGVHECEPKNGSRDLCKIEMAAEEMRRALTGIIPHCLRNCVNKEYYFIGGPTPLKHLDSQPRDEEYNSDDAELKL